MMHARPAAAPNRDLALSQLALSAEQLVEVRRVLQRHLPGVEVRAFGSRARGTPKPASDLDLMVFSSEPLGPRQQGLLADAFAESDLPFKVDVVDANSASASFRARALAQSILVQAATPGIV